MPRLRSLRRGTIPLSWIHLLALLAVPAVAQERGGLGVGIGAGSDGRPTVTAVAPGGGAAEAGVKVGDVLLEVNGFTMEELKKPDDFFAQVQGPVGSKCKLVLERDGKKVKVTVTRSLLGPPPGQNPNNPGPGPGPGPAPAPGPAVGPGPAPGLADGGNQEVPDPSLHLALVPEAAHAGPPDLIRPGTRLVYFGASASVPGARTQLVLDDNGKWVNKQTGQRYGEQDVPGTGGAGYNVVRVNHVDKKVVALSSATYVYDVTDKSSTYAGAAGMVTNAGLAADYWANPKLLANVKEINQGGVRIVRMPYVLNNRKYNAIRFQTDTDRGHTAYVYDLESGLMIFHGSSTQGAGVVTPPVGGGQPGVGAGSTMLVTGWIVDVKQVDVPWKDAPVPQWVGQFRQMRYEGAHTTAVQGAGQFSRGVVMVVTPKAAGNGWLRWVSDMSIQGVNGLPDDTSQMHASSGHASAGGLWISPQGLAKLQRGQVIETNEITNTKTLITDIGRGYVTLSEIGAKHRIDLSYDTNTGALVGIGVGLQNGLGTTNIRTKLVGQR